MVDDPPKNVLPTSIKKWLFSLKKPSHSHTQSATQPKKKQKKTTEHACIHFCPKMLFWKRKWMKKLWQKRKFKHPPPQKKSFWVAFTKLVWRLADEKKSINSWNQTLTFFFKSVTYTLHLQKMNTFFFSLALSLSSSCLRRFLFFRHPRVKLSSVLFLLPLVFIMIRETFFLSPSSPSSKRRFLPLFSRHEYRRDVLMWFFFFLTWGAPTRHLNCPNLLHVRVFFCDRQLPY